MNAEQILEAIADGERTHGMSEWTISPEKLAAFLAEHLEEKVVDETV